MAAFSYSYSLQGRHIRLLEILPGGHSDSIECQLHHVDLDQAPSFEALSYVWGDASVREDILCEGKLFDITINLRDALQRLRSPTRARLIWADAICINQGDTRERSQQVQFMRDIYSHAQQVVVWLGKENGDAIGTAVALMQTIYEMCSRYADSIHEDVVELSGEYGGLVNVRPHDLKSCRNDWTALQQFFKRPWFQRVWCIQEVMVARDPTLICGETEIQWTKVGVTAQWLNEQDMAEDFNVPDYLQNIDYYNAIVMFDRKTMKESSLLGALRLARDFQATDPRDKVYALLGLVLEENGRDLVTVDYEKKVATVYTDVAVETIPSYGTLSVLSYVQHASNLDESNDIPSWVPRWDVSMNAMSFEHGLPDFRDWSASGNRKESGFVVEDNRVMELSGLVFEDVASVTSVWDVDLFKSASKTIVDHPFLDLWTGCFNKQSAYASPEHAVITMAYTLTGGLNVNHQMVEYLDDDGRHQHDSDYLTYIRRLLDLAGKSTTRDPMDMVLMEGDWRRYEIAASRYCDQRRFFWTRTGYYGLGPACMREGDVVVVLFGGATPYVLRRVGTEFLFLGACFVLDIMRGELIEKLDEGIGVEQEFRLI